MWPFGTSTKYQPLKNELELEERESIASSGQDEQSRPYNSRSKSPIIWAIAALVLLLISIGSFTAAWLHSPPDGLAVGGGGDDDDNAEVDGADGDIVDDRCPLRLSWHSLSTADEYHYIDSVKCLNTINYTDTDSTLYEIFPWIHSHVGYYTHNSAPFLPWHRYFLHTYETTLREHCGYSLSGLVYWDWTLDWDHLSKSTVFDPVDGFGGDGDPEGEITVGNHGRCLIDGPFKDIEAKYYDVKFHPHCLSRGFRNDGGLGEMNGEDISPENIGEVMKVDDYETFVTQMESKVHDTIPFGIGGDFETFTAPYDPLFFLHHTQLDRLWWLWQQRDPSHLEAYNGHNHRHSIEMASLGDSIKLMQGFAPDIQVREVMDTKKEDGLLCYRY